MSLWNDFKEEKGSLEMSEENLIKKAFILATVRNPATDEDGFISIEEDNEYMKKFGNTIAAEVGTYVNQLILDLSRESPEAKVNDYDIAICVTKLPHK